MDSNGDVVRIVESQGGPLQRCVIEAPLRRVASPDDPGNLTPVGREPGSAALGEKIVEEPEPSLQFGTDRGHRSAKCVLDEVAVDRDETRTTFGPQRRRDTCGATTPVIASECGDPVAPVAPQPSAYELR